MLDILGWETMEQSRRTARLVAFYKMRNDMTHTERLKDQLKPSKRRPRGKENDQHYIPPFCSTQYRSESFLPRTVREWNALPQEAVDAKTLDTFVSRVRQLSR